MTLRLQVGIEIDQQVAAADQVDAGEGRIADQAVGREDAQVAHLLGQLVGAGLLGEEALQALRRDALERARRDSGRPGRSPAPPRRCRCRRPAPWVRRRSAIHVLAQQDGDRVDLLAGGAAGHPHPDGHRSALPSNSLGITSGASAANASGSRKKAVTPISRSRNSSVTSSGSRRRRSMIGGEVAELHAPACGAARGAGRSCPCSR